MSEIQCKDYGLVSNVCVYDLYESIKAAKYAMLVDVDQATPLLTKGLIALAQTPIGQGHDNYLNGIRVSMDVTFTVKAWTEAERYHFFDFVTSQSTMHRITHFDMDTQYIGYVDSAIVARMKELVAEYIDDPTPEKYLVILYSNPTGFKLTARITTNYRQLKTQYAQRKDHRLPEWREYCKWIETLPCSDLITGGESTA